MVIHKYLFNELKNILIEVFISSAGENNFKAL